MALCLRRAHNTSASTASAALWNMQYSALFYLLECLPIEIIQHIFSLMLPVIIIADSLQILAIHGGTHDILWTRSCPSRLLSLKVSMFGRYLAYVTVGSPHVYVFDLWRHQEHTVIKINSGICLDFEFDNMGQGIYILIANQLLRVAQLQFITLTTVKEYNSHEYNDHALNSKDSYTKTDVAQYNYAFARMAISSNGEYFGYSKAVWHNKHLTVYHEKDRVDDYIYVACFSPNSAIFVSGCKVHTFGLVICVWNTKTGHLICNLQVAERIRTCAFSPDGSMLVLGNGSASCDISIYETKNWTLRKIITTNHINAITNIMFIDSSFIITSCLNGLICLINVS